MSSIYNQMKAKIGSLVNNESAYYWYSIIGMCVCIILAGKISKEVGLSHNDIKLVIYLVAALFLALLLTSALLNLNPPPEKSPLMSWLERMFSKPLYINTDTRTKFNPLARTKYVSPPPAPPYTPPRSRDTV